MEYLQLIGSVALLNLLAAMSPGPDFAMVVRNSLCYSRRSGIFTSLGISLALGIHLFYCAAGIGLLISKSTLLFTLIKVLGAGYLVFIGLSSFFAKGSKLDVAAEKSATDLPRAVAFRMGFLTNVLNPKATLFFLSLFTLVIGSSTPLYIVLIISAIIMFTALGWFSIVSLFLAQPSVQKIFLKYEKAVNYTLGAFLILIGIKIAFTF